MLLALLDQFNLFYNELIINIELPIHLVKAWSFSEQYKFFLFYISIFSYIFTLTKYSILQDTTEMLRGSHLASKLKLFFELVRGQDQKKKEK